MLPAHDGGRPRARGAGLAADRNRGGIRHGLFTARHVSGRRVRRHASDDPVVRAVGRSDWIPVPVDGEFRDPDVRDAAGVVGAGFLDDCGRRRAAGLGSRVHVGADDADRLPAVPEASGRDDQCAAHILLRGTGRTGAAGHVLAAPGLGLAADVSPAGGGDRLVQHHHSSDPVSPPNPR